MEILLLLLLINTLQEADTNFNDLGKLMLAGFAAAIVCAIAFTFVRLRLRERKPQNSGFLTIASIDEKK